MFASDAFAPRTAVTSDKRVFHLLGRMTLEGAEYPLVYEGRSTLGKPFICRVNYDGRTQDGQRLSSETILIEGWRL